MTYYESFQRLAESTERRIQEELRAGRTDATEIREALQVKSIFVHESKIQKVLDKGGEAY